MADATSDSPDTATAAQDNIVSLERSWAGLMKAVGFTNPSNVRQAARMRRAIVALRTRRG